jgi:hypothetical protein
MSDVTPDIPAGCRMSYVDIVFDGPSIAGGLTFVEVEDSTGHSVRRGEWIQRDDGYVVLRLLDPEPLRGLLSDAEGWFEEIQHAGYAVPVGQESAFSDFWDKLQEQEGAQ